MRGGPLSKVAFDRWGMHHVERGKRSGVRQTTMG